MASFNELKNRIVTHLNYPNHIQIKPADIVLYPGPNKIRLFWGEDLLQDSQIELAVSFNGEEIPVYVIKTLYNQVLLSVNLPEEDGIFEMVVTGQCIDSASAISTCKNVFSSEVINMKNPAPPQFIQEPTILSNVYTRSILQNTGTLETATENIGFYFGNDPDSNQPGVFYKSEITEKIFLKLEFPFTNKIEGNSINFTINSLNEEFLSYLLHYYSEDFINNKIINNTYTVNILDIYNQYLFLVEPIFIDDDSGNSVFINLSAIDANIEYFYKSSSLTTTPWKIDNLFVKIINTATYHSTPSNIAINKIYNDGSIYKIGDFPIQRIDYGKHFYDERNISRPSNIPINYIGNLFNPDPTLYNEIWTRFGGSINITNNGGLYNSLTLAYDTEATTKKYSSYLNNIFLYPIECYQNKFFKISFNYWTISQGTLQFYFENSETSLSELIFEINTELNSGVSSWEYTFDSTAFHGLSFKEIKLYWNGATPISLSDLSIVEEYELGPSYWLNIPLTENIRGESYNLQYLWLGTSNQSLSQKDNINSNTGNPTYIFGEDNTVLGDLWVNDGYNTRGIQIHSDAAVSWIGSVGYKGRNVAQTQGIGGWLIWSGSVGQPYNPIDNPHYKGIGMELHAGMNSGALRFFTDPATNTGLLELTGSIYAENGYFSGELQATSGKIAGLYITDGYIQNAVTQNDSTILFGSSSLYYNSTDFSQRTYTVDDLSSAYSTLVDFKHDSYLYSNSGIPTNPATHYYYINGSSQLCVDLSSADAYGDISVNSSNGYLRMFIGDNSDPLNPNIYNAYQNFIPGDTISVYVSMDFFTDIDYNNFGYADINIEYSDDGGILKTQSFVMENKNPTKDTTTTCQFNFLSVCPKNAKYLKFWFNFHRINDVAAVPSCVYTLNQISIKGNTPFIEISPDGLFYRANEYKYIKLGKGSFEIKGTEIEADELRVTNQIIANNTLYIGSGSILGGHFQLNQRDPISGSGFWQNFGNNINKQWIDSNGIYNFSHENKIMDVLPQHPVYTWLNGNFGTKLFQLNSDGTLESPSNYGRYLHSYYGIQSPKIIATTDIELNSYVIDTIDPDPLLTANSDQAVPTQAAVKSYVGDQLVSASISAGSGIGGAGTTGYLPYWSAATTLSDSQLYYDSVNQRFGIGTTPTVKFEVAGTIKATSLTATSISETSDERLKENIVDLGSQLFNIYKLFPKRFNFISNINKQEIGLIAQEVMRVYPELVVQNGEHYSIEYSKLTTILISGMKELIDENENLKNRMENIEISLRVLSDLIREKQ